VTTTPRPTAIIRGLLVDPGCVVTRGSTYANRANLAPTFFEQIITRYEGTRLGRQELEGELLTDVPGALWTLAMLEGARIGTPTTRPAPAPAELARVVVAIDPAVTSGDEADETGLIVAAKGRDGHGYVLRDRSGRVPAIEWARRAVALYREHRADRIVAEVNNGGDLVEAQIRVVDKAVSYRAVHASRGKRVRAEPVAALYEQGKVHHVGLFPALEDEMVTFVPDNHDGSPDRVDALVWALTDLMLTPRAESQPVASRSSFTG